jgi:HPt (histidine-containing phosphotransfer) domain-containing protein
MNIQAMRALLYPATRTVYATMDIRAKTNARVAILQALPALLDEVERLRSDWFAGGVDADGNELVTIRKDELEQLREEVKQLEAANRLQAAAAEIWRQRSEGA